jgi:signal transduction histidine kinase
VVSVTLRSALPACTRGTGWVSRAADSAACGGQPSATPYRSTTGQMHLQGHEMLVAPTYAECMANRLGTRIADTLVRGVTRPPAPRPAWLQRGRLDLVAAADVVLASVMFGITNILLVIENGQAGEGVPAHPLFLLVLVSLAVCAPLGFRTWYPLGSWTGAVVAMIWTTRALPLHGAGPAGYLAAGVITTLLCLYAVTVRCKPWVAVAAGLVTIILFLGIGSEGGVASIFTAAVTVFVGAIVRSRRGNRQELAVVERRHEGERALLEERQRIARELHDVVAHHMSVIAIQAEAAPYKVADPAPELVESFADIRASALSGLQELRRVLGVLRQDGPLTMPQPGLDDLAVLLESARDGGVTVEADITGSPRQLPEGVDLSAYRIVQEALSNAMRHAPGAEVRVNLDYGDAELKIQVRNTGRDDEGNDMWRGVGAGHGIIGMRERAAMLGGDLIAGPTQDGQFLVSAALPLSTGSREEAK